LQKKKNIAIIGSGLAGLSAAWYLKNDFVVDLYERSPTAGMDAHSLDIDNKNRIDVPLRVFYSGYYPTLTSLYNEAGIEIEKTNYAASFTRLENYEDRNNHNGATYYRYINFLIAGKSVPFFGSWNSLRGLGLRINLDLMRFYRETGKIFANKVELASLENITIYEYLRSAAYSESFIRFFILPVFSAICTCNFEAVKNYPAATIIEYINKGIFFDGVSRVKYGTKLVVDILCRGCHNIHNDKTIHKITKNGSTITVHGSSGFKKNYDFTIIATGPAQASLLLSNSFEYERSVLASIPTEKSFVSIHRNEKLMPHKKYWSAVNFLVNDRSANACVTIFMNAVQKGLKKSPPLFQSWNPPEAIHDSEIIRKEFERPLVSVESLKSIRQLNSRNNKNQIFFAGSYMLPGIPLLENAALSAKNIASFLIADQKQKLA